MMLTYEVYRESVIRRRAFSGCSIVATRKLANIEEDHDQKVERVQTCLPNGEASVTIGGIATLNLYTDPKDFILPWLVSRIRVNADEIITLVIRRGLVRQDVPTHQVAHDQVLGTGGHDRQTQELLFGHH